jgi:hypothetical protein
MASTDVLFPPAGPVGSYTLTLAFQLLGKGFDEEPPQAFRRFFVVLRRLPSSRKARLGIRDPGITDTR